MKKSTKSLKNKIVGNLTGASVPAGSLVPAKQADLQSDLHLFSLGSCLHEPFLNERFIFN